MNLNFASLDLDGNITACVEGPFRVSGNLNIAALIVARQRCPTATTTMSTTASSSNSGMG
jgi:hypothetical protein